MGREPDDRLNLRGCEEIRVKVLITGAAGFAGSHLIDLLLRDGTEVWGVQRPAGDRSRDFIDTRIRWMQFDVTDAGAVRHALQDLRPAMVYHLAGAAHVGRAWSNSTEPLETNVIGTHYLLDALRTSGTRARVLIPSSAMVYAPASTPLREDSPVSPDGPYGLSKLAQERLGLRAVTTDGQQVIVARAFNHIGPRQSQSFALAGFAKQIAEIEAGLRPPLIRVGNLQPRRDFTDVRDTVRAYRDLMERGRTGSVYNVCSGTGWSVGELLDQLIARAKLEVQIEVDRERLRPADAPVLVGDRARILNEVGWHPEIPIDRTLDDLLEYWRNVVGQRL